MVRGGALRAGLKSILDGTIKISLEFTTFSGGNRVMTVTARRLCSAKEGTELSLMSRRFSLCVTHSSVCVICLKPFASRICALVGGSQGETSHFLKSLLRHSWFASWPSLQAFGDSSECACKMLWVIVGSVHKASLNCVCRCPIALHVSKRASLHLICSGIMKYISASILQVFL